MKLTKLTTLLSLGAILLPTSLSVVSCAPEGYVDEDPKVFTREDFLYREKNNIKPIIPKGTTTIAERAFDVTSKSTVIIDFPVPNSVKIIEEFVFYNCEIKSGFKLPNSIEKMGRAVFEKAKFYTDIDWPPKLEIVPKYTFRRTDFSALDKLNDQQNHKGINWPENSSKNVKIIGVYAFAGTKIPYHFQLPNTLEIIRGGGLTNIEYPWIEEHKDGSWIEDEQGNKINDPNYKAPFEWPKGPDLNNDGYPDGILLQSTEPWELGKWAEKQSKEYRYKFGDPLPFVRQETVVISG